MNRIWVVEIDDGDGPPGLLPEWRHTRADAERYLDNYRRLHLVDCAMRVVRFDRRPARRRWR